VSDHNNRPANESERAVRTGRPGDSNGGPDDAVIERREQLDDDTAVIALPIGSRQPEQPERVWAFGSWEADSNLGDQAPNDPYVGLINLGFIRAALRRQMRLWLGLGIVGFLLGFGVLTALPPAQKAATTVLLYSPPGAPPGQAIADDQSLIESRMMAAAVVKKLGLNMTPAAFVSHYTAAATTNQVLTITVSSTSTAESIREANGLASGFLVLQKQLLNSQNTLTNQSYQAQISGQQSVVDTTSKRLNGLKASTPGGKSSQITSLQNDYNQENNGLIALRQTVATDEAQNQAQNAAVITGSYVLDPAAPVKASKKRELALYAGGGLVGGIALGIAIVAIGALVSDKLRRRDDVARLMQAPVRLSVRRIRTSRLLPGRHGLGLSRHRDVQRISAHLGNLVARGAGGPATLAVIPVDDPQIPAVCLVSLAVSCAQQGLHAVIADLAPGTPAARMLKASQPGVHEVSVRGTALTLIVPDRDDLPLAGPFRKPRWAQVAEPVARACESADVILTLAPVDPALGAEYIPGWTMSAVAMVTAGESSAQRVFSVGEMLRLAGVPAISGVLVNSDKGDESLGVVPGPAAPREPDLGLSGMLGARNGHLAIADPELEAGVDPDARAILGNGKPGT
jgi:capsular polysaccharide biosynthesis protein